MFLHLKVWSQTSFCIVLHFINLLYTDVDSFSHLLIIGT